MSRIAVEHLVKEFGDHAAVNDVSFSVERGALCVLLGPSGCGKSTTLRLIAGLEEPSSGRIEIEGRDVTHLPSQDRRIAMVFQSYALFPHLSVAQNIVFGLEVRRVPRAERETRMRKVAALTGLAPYLARKPAELSGGQRQRVALARAIISEQPVCLMDEPLSNLDAKLRHEMRVEIRALQQRLGMTMIYVTHDQIEAMTMADRVILMNDGRDRAGGLARRALRAPGHHVRGAFHRRSADEFDRDGRREWFRHRGARRGHAPRSPSRQRHRRRRSRASNISEPTRSSALRGRPANPSR